MIKFKRDECLAHTVVKKFIELKWNCSTLKTFYYINLLIYITFVICLTTHIVKQTKDPMSAESSGLQAISVIALIINAFNLIKEIYQMKVMKRYFCDVTNFIEWAMYISSFVYFVPLTDKNHTQIGAGAVAVFLAWVNFTLFLKMFSSLGIYIIMANRVLVSILKVMPIILLFIVAFGVAFLPLMTNDEGFGDFPISILTTFIMVTSEIDYRDVFLQDASTPSQFLQRLFLVLIVLTCGIVLMNFLIALAVDDISKILQRSEAEERLQKATVIKALESSLYSSYLQAPVIDNSYFEWKSCKFVDWITNVQHGIEEEDDSLSTSTTIDDAVALRLDSHIDDVALRLDGRINDVTLRLDNLTRLMEKLANPSHSK